MHCADAKSSPRSRPCCANRSKREPNSFASAPPTYASQNRRNDHLAVARNAIVVPCSPVPKIASRTAAITSATRDAAAIAAGVVIRHFASPRNSRRRCSGVPTGLAVFDIGHLLKLDDCSCRYLIQQYHEGGFGLNVRLVLTHAHIIHNIVTVSLPH